MQPKENRLIKRMSGLIRKEMNNNTALPFNKAFKRVVDTHPHIKSAIQSLESELIQEKAR